jgi:DNA-binding CsgD family transcriptional regulator
VRRSPGTPAPLTPRELEVARLAVRKLTYGQMGQALGISPFTARAHLLGAYRKTHTGSRAALAEWLARGA